MHSSPLPFVPAPLSFPKESGAFLYEFRFAEDKSPVPFHP
jgi:hypothetical protein